MSGNYVMSTNMSLCVVYVLGTYLAGYLPDKGRPVNQTSVYRPRSSFQGDRSVLCSKSGQKEAVQHPKAQHSTVAAKHRDRAISVQKQME
jgi:hypothetical protein